MSELPPYDWDEDRSVDVTFQASLQEFESACVLQDELDDAVDRYEQSIALRDLAAELRAQKRIVWAPDNLPLRLGGIYNPVIALNYLSEIAHNGLLERRAAALVREADELYPDSRA